MKTYTHLKDRPLIYGIINTITGKIYIGKTKCIYKRCAQYLYDFQNRALGHINDYLFNSMKKYGIENFDMVPIEFCTNEELTEKELYWINKFQSNNRIYGYNLRLDGREGMIVSNETSNKIRRNLKQQWIDGRRKNHGEKLKAKWATTPERKISMSAYFTNLLTKWAYNITFPDKSQLTCNFKKLKELGLESSLSNFHRTKSDRVMCKGHIIIREKL